MGASASSSVWLWPQRDEQDPSMRERARRHGNGHADPPTILVVEDEVLIRLAICDYLRQAGYRVVEGSTGEEAQRVFRAGERIEVLFSDVELGPGMNGLALAKWVRQNFPEVRILLTSGTVKLSDQRATFGDSLLLSKPYSHESVEQQIRQLVSVVGRCIG